MALFWHLSGTRFVDLDGNPLWPGFIVRFSDAENGEPIPVYRDPKLKHAEFAVVASSDSTLPTVYFDDQTFRLVDQKAFEKNGSPIESLTCLGLPIIPVSGG